MANVKLTAEPRSGSGKNDNNKLRASGKIPAVVYGYGEETRSVAIDAHETELLFSKIHVENTVISLSIDGEKGAVKTLVREVQKHPARGNVLHVDFYQIHAGEMVHIQIPLSFVGASVGVKNGGMLQHTMDELDIRVSADNIPERLEVDVSELEVGDSIHVRELKVPAGVEVLDAPDRSVCSVIPPQAGIADAVAPEAAAAAATGEPEVIRRKKEDGE